MDVALLAFSALCQQSTECLPRSSKGRFVVILLYMSLMAFYTSYSADILALLQSGSSHVRTFNDLLRSGLEIGAEDNGCSLTVCIFYWYFAKTYSLRVQRTTMFPIILKFTWRHFRFLERIQNITDWVKEFHELERGYRPFILKKQPHTSW